MEIALRHSKIIIYVAIFLTSGCEMLFYTPYVPMFRHSDPDHTIEEQRALLTQTHIEQIQIVLQENNEKFYLEDGQLYIKRSLHNDKDLLSNYTMKALYLESNQ